MTEMPSGFTYGLVPRETVFGMSALAFLKKIVDRSIPMNFSAAK